jgi:Xaa-Pro aminopeptidase
MLAEVAQVIADLGLTRDNIGVVGLHEVMLHGDVMALNSLLPQAELADATAPVDDIMAIKSPVEIAAATETCNTIAHALAVFQDELAPGKSERDVMAQAVRALHERGCLDGIAHLTNGVPPFFRPPTERLIAPDDIFKVSLEFAGPAGYWIELSGMFSFIEPPDRARRYFDTAKKALENAAAALRPGNTGADLTRAVEETFRADGWNVTGRGIWDGHAIGLNVIRPPYGVADSTDIYRENMIINVHPGLIVDEDGWGFFMQDNFLVTPHGGRPLGDYAHEWQVIP